MLARLPGPLQNLQRGHHDLPVTLLISRAANRKVIRERRVRHSRSLHTTLHRQRDGWYPPPLYLRRYQPHGPVTQRSRRREQRNVHPIVYEHLCHLGRGPLFKLAGVVDRAHEAEVPVVQLPDHAFLGQPTQRPQRKDAVQILPIIGGAPPGVVGMGPGKLLGLTRDLPVRAIPRRIVYVETLIIRQMNAAGGDEREPAIR